MEVVTSWMEEGLRQGRREGRQEGRQEGRREGRREGIEEGQIRAARDAVIEILQARFKRIPPALKRTLKGLDDRKRLKLLLRQAATAATLKDFERRLSQA